MERRPASRGKGRAGSRRRFLSGAATALAVAFTGMAGPAAAQTTFERALAGETIRVGYSNEAPYAFQGEGGRMDGFVNVTALAILEELGIANVEGVLTEWGALIPGLQAGRFDIITAGMFVLPGRCEQVAFTEPMGEFAEHFLVASGNPHGIHSFEDIVENEDFILVTGAGYSTVEHARTLGVPDQRIMQVADPAAILQAVVGGRAHAASATYFAMQDLAEKSGGRAELADPFSAPEFTKGWSAFAFREGDQDFVDAFNEVIADFIGSEEFLELVAPYGYSGANVPGEGVTTAALCAQ